MANEEFVIGVYSAIRKDLIRVVHAIARGQMTLGSNPAPPFKAVVYAEVDGREYSIDLWESEELFDTKEPAFALARQKMQDILKEEGLWSESKPSPQIF